MALFHLSVTQTKRSAGQSAIASAAYRAGERLYSEYYGEYSDYTRKGGVICSDILLPSHAPPEYADRQTLWNAVEKAERGKNAQLAYSFDIALQNEFSLEENIALARRFLLENFVSRGMVVDFAVHQPDREDGGIPNPHFHVLCPIRPIEQDGKKVFRTIGFIVVILPSSLGIMLGDSVSFRYGSPLMVLCSLYVIDEVLALILFYKTKMAAEDENEIDR